MVIGAVKAAVVVTSNARLAPPIAKPPGRVPAEFGSMGVEVVVPAVLTPAKLNFTAPSWTETPVPVGVWAGGKLSRKITVLPLLLLFGS